MVMTWNDTRDRIIERAVADGDFRARLLADPRVAIGELTGQPVPEAVSVQVHQESAASFHLVLPPSGRLTDDELAHLTAGGDPGGGVAGPGEDDDGDVGR